MIKLVLQVILLLAPSLPKSAAIQYADLIVFEAKWYNIDPLLITSLIEVESNWNARKRSRTNDYGLMQVHVARRGSSNFYGREQELYDPRINIREGTRIAWMWRNYHNKWCKGDHPWWAHYKWGKYVKGTVHAEKVLSLYKWTQHRFKHRALPQLLSAR